MPQRKIEEILCEMVRRAQVMPDGKGIFIGSPRYIMEGPDSVSSGPLYHKLRQRGLTSEGTGRKARWLIPATVMAEFKRCRPNTPNTINAHQQRTQT